MLLVVGQLLLVTGVVGHMGLYQLPELKLFLRLGGSYVDEIEVEAAFVHHFLF